MSAPEVILLNVPANVDAVQIVPAASGPLSVDQPQLIFLVMSNMPSNTIVIQENKDARENVRESNIVNTINIPEENHAREDVGEICATSLIKAPSFNKPEIMTQVEAVPVPSEVVCKIARGPSKFSSCQTSESFVLKCRLLDKLKSGKLQHLKRKSEIKDNLEVSLRFKQRELKLLLKAMLISVFANVVSGSVNHPDLWDSVDEAECYSRPISIPGELREWCQQLVNDLRATRNNPRSSCPVCGKICRRFYLEVHMRLHSDNRPYNCRVCHMGFTQLSLCKRHEEMHNANRVKSFQCSLCDYKAFTKKTLNTHMESKHEASENVQCPKCSKQFRNDKSLQAHLKGHDLSEQLCDICGKVFRNFATVTSHRRRMHEGLRKPYSCDICNKVFSRCSELKTHKLRHKNDRSFKCEVCEKAFLCSHDLKKHMRVHTDEKPFHCNVCGRTFRQRNTLRVHMYTHGATRPYECPKCAKQFSHKAYLTKHKCPFDDFEKEEGIGDEKKNDVNDDVEETGIDHKQGIIN